VSQVATVRSVVSSRAPLVTSEAQQKFMTDLYDNDKPTYMQLVEINELCIQNDFDPRLLASFKPPSQESNSDLKLTLSKLLNDCRNSSNISEKVLRFVGDEP
jgi:hypothetical protein